MSREELITKYWKYYLMLEQEFVDTLDYVEIGQDNVYSNRYAMLLQAVGAELDCFFKEYCNIAPGTHSTISDYAVSILNSWPDIRDQKVCMTAEKKILQPYKDWDIQCPKQSLPWWEGFDTIKHSRTANNIQANQINTVNALAALYIIEMRELSLICNGKLPDIPESPSMLFDLVDWNYRFLPLGEGFALIDGAVCMTDTAKIQWKN